MNGNGGKQTHCISVHQDLRHEFEAMRAFIESYGVPLSEYMVKSALLCARLGIVDPSNADFSGLAVADNHSATAPQDNGGMTMGRSASKAFDKLF